MRTQLVALALLAGAPHLRAQDVAVLTGPLMVNANEERTFAAAASYTHPAGRHGALSLSYLNEGHPLDHHRDGIGTQFWLRGGEPERGWSFAAGVGGYYYFDTARAVPSGAYSNDHGWAPIYSLSAQWHFARRWFAQLQANRIVPRNKDHTTALLFGLGYRFDGVAGDKLHQDQPSSDDTITVLAGQTIVNSFESERTRARAIEYRRAAGPYVDWSVSWLNEGDTPRTRRDGVVGQLWLVRSLNSRVELGMGAGPYLAFDVHGDAGRQSRMAALVSVVGRYHFSERWVGQLSWNRVVTDYHRDADVLLLGLGARF